MSKPLKGEAAIKKACEDLLAAERIPCYRMNAGDRFGMTNGRKWRIRGHEKGTPDLLAHLDEGPWLGSPEHAFTVCWIECKAPGQLPTPDQLAFADAARNRGETWLLVDNPDILIQWLKENRAR